MPRIPIYLTSSTTGDSNILPYATGESQPLFRWDIPSGVVQDGYCLELKTRFKVTREDGTYDYAYYRSGLVSSSTAEHQVSLEMIQAVWAGAVEVRLRLYSGDTLTYSTHDPWTPPEDESDSNSESSSESDSSDSSSSSNPLDEYPYTFEDEPQYFLWDSNWDGYYFVMDPQIDQPTGTYTPTFVWGASTDEDDDQILQYQLQYSRTPLFNDGEYATLLANGNNTYKDYATTEISNIEPVIGLQSRFTVEVLEAGMLFFRVRAWDGLDYGEWSISNAFYSHPSSPPTCWIVDVQSNCTYTDPNSAARPNGEVEITIHIEDPDTPLVTGYLQYRLSSESTTSRTPCSLDSSAVALPVGKDITLTWYSSRQLPNQNVVVFIYLYAYDGDSESDEDSWVYTVTVNNTGIGYGYSDSSSDAIDCRIRGRVRNYERWIQIPDGKAIATGTTSYSGEPIYEPAPMPSATGNQTYEEREAWEAESWGIYWSKVLGDEYDLCLFSPGEYLAQRIPQKIMRPDYRMYDGWDDGDVRIEAEKLYLEYEDEYEAREHTDGEEFVRYYEIGNQRLGRGTANITYFVKPPTYGLARVYRPIIVKAGEIGLYHDSMALNNSVSDVFGNVLNDTDIQNLMNTFPWNRFYNFDPMFDPSIQPVASVLGRWDENRISYSSMSQYYDEEITWYWTLFEYTVEIALPAIIKRDGNDKFACRLNGTGRIEGSILEDDVDLLVLNNEGKLTDDLTGVLKRLFPTDIFQSPSSSDATFTDNGCKIKIRSLKQDSNRSFRYLDTDASCLEVFGLDHNTRYSSRLQCAGSENGYAVYNLYRSSSSSSGSTRVYEVTEDTGDCLGGVDGVANTSEPLFTCDPVHVNRYGCHYKYTAKRYLESGKVWIRRYHLTRVYQWESNDYIRDPLPDETTAPTMGYRNYRLKYIGKSSLGEELFIKEVIPGRIGGAPAVCKMIDVKFENEMIEELGYWAAGTDLENADTKDCLTHQWSDKENAWIRKKAQEAAQGIRLQDCWVSEYVELNVGWEKPFWNQHQGIGRIDKRQPISLNGDSPWGYKWYVLGAYRPVPDQEEITPYEGGIKFVVSSKYAEDETDNSVRFGQVWKTIAEDSSPENRGIAVDPGHFLPRGYEASIETWGYQPDPTIHNYFKVDSEGIWEGQIIPSGSNYVHGIHGENDITTLYRSKIFMTRRIMSDVEKIELPETEGSKLPYLDWRLRGRMPLEMRYYYSALPQDESPAYATRPPEIYGEDRPTRITGFIDSMSSVIPWKFLYLQTGWNTYNLIHWEGVQDNSIYAKIEVAELDANGVTGSYMTLKTKNSEWFSQFSCYLIPYVKLQQSDYVDTLNGSFYTVEDGIRTAHYFENGHTYRFRICGVNINSGSANTAVLSTTFEYSLDAYSPPIITDVTYNKWSKKFTITFRFDDAKGRDYDLTDFFYATYEQDEASPDDSQFIELGTNVLAGTLENLASNVSGDNVISESYLIKHKVTCSETVLSDITGKLIRFRLDAVPSEDRIGMDLPVFYFLMWGNELLKKADDTIDSILGKTSRWAYLTSDPDDKGNTTTGWVYLSEEDAITTLGKRATEQAIIDSINEAFEDWYITVAKFVYAGWDALWNYLQIEERDESLFNADGLFDEFLELENLTTAYNSFCNKWESRPLNSWRHKYFAQTEYPEEFAFYWANRAWVWAYSISGMTDNFDDWFEDNRYLSREESKPLYIESQGLLEDYATYLENNPEYEDDDEGRTAFLVDNGYQSAFESYYSKLNNYPDGRYDDRKAFVETYYATEYEDWLNNPVDAYGNSILEILEQIDKNVDDWDEDERLRLFIASDRERWNKLTYTNAGKQNANIYFMSVAVNGVTYSQQMQTAQAKIQEYDAELDVAYADRNKYETIHRRQLIRKGYFINGWKNNQVYLPSGTQNEPFRFRVENQPVTGSRTNTETGLTYDGTLPDSVEPIAGYDTRWDIYFHFQMDFYDTFDSQDGLPFRDYLWERLDCSGYAGSDVDSIEIEGVQYIRIMGGIEAEEGSHVLPENTYTADSSTYGTVQVSSDPYSFQFAGRFSIPKSDLPGEWETDQLPEYWDAGSSESEKFSQMYFWRVCPYNLVKRPIWEREMAEVSKIELYREYQESSWSWENYRMWKISVANKFRGDKSYSLILSDEGYYYDYPFAYCWIATTKLTTPIWTLDCNSACFHSSEAYYNNFLPGTNNSKEDTNYSDNPLRNSYRTRLNRGELVFLTDRPREYDPETQELTYIEDENNHFKSLWLPFNTNRRKPWIMRDADDGSWLLVAHKDSKNRNGYTEMVITLSRGLSPQTWGEECQLFPTSSLNSDSSVIEDAQSFENPCLLKVDNTYILYFNVRKEGAIWEVWQAKSSDLWEWTDFKKVTFTYPGADTVDYGQELLDPAVYYQPNSEVSGEAGTWMMLACTGVRVLRYESSDGLTFALSTVVHTDRYQTRRPTLAGGRVYCGFESGDLGIIVSFPETGGDPSVEKGSQTFTDDGDIYFSPFVFEDYDKGTPIIRLVYEHQASTYAYNGTAWSELTNLMETALFTEYLEEYSWEKKYLNNEWEAGADEYFGDGVHMSGSRSCYYLDSRNTTSVPIVTNTNTGNAVSLYTSYGNSIYVDIANLDILLLSNNEPLAVKFPFYLESIYEDTESEGAWLDFANVADTEATLTPETVDPDYNFSDYSLARYISENGLDMYYEEWLSETHPNISNSDSDDLRKEFLYVTKQYSLYLKWALKGPGVYRHLNAVKRTSYTGDGT